MRHKKFIREFTPNWFTIIMGTGGASLVLNQFSLSLPFFWWIGMPIWALNIILFILFISLFTLRFIFYPAHLKRMLLYSIQPVFLACIAMGLVTIVDGFRVFGISIIGQAAALGIAICLWWISVVLGLLFSWLAFFFVNILRKPKQAAEIAFWLLPIVACEVAASSGAMLIPSMSAFTRNFAFVVCIALWAISVLLALCIITLILKQFITRSINKPMLAPSAWLILGPIGNGMLGLMSLAYASHFIIIPHSMVSFQHAIQLMPGVALIAAIMIWGFGFWWLIVALIIGVLHTITRIQFALSWWTFTFPLAMYSLGTLAIAPATDSYLFLISGIICGALLIISNCSGV